MFPFLADVSTDTSRELSSVALSLALLAKNLFSVVSESWFFVHSEVGEFVLS